MLAPQSVIELAITPEYRDSTFLTRFTMACFGAQACLFGVMSLLVSYTSRGFLAFGLCMFPFFLFDWYFHVVVPVLTSLGMLDFAGNAIMFGLAIQGWRVTRAEELRA